MNDYSKLDRYSNYDHEKAELFAEALVELREVQEREQFLLEIVSQNKDLKPFVWRTKDGKYIAMHNITDDHLSRILAHLTERDMPVHPAMEAEAKRRRLSIPEGAEESPERDEEIQFS